MDADKINSRNISFLICVYLRLSAVAVLLLAAPLVAAAGEAVPTENDPVAAARAVQLANELRCLVCQNQSIADSNAELAVDLRRQIREQIASGRSDGEIVDFMVARYGDFVLYRPPFKVTTVLLWLGPLLLVVAGFVVLAWLLRARRRVEAPQLTPEERGRVERMLDGAPADGGAVPAPSRRRCDPGAGESVLDNPAGSMRTSTAASPSSGAPAPRAGTPKP